MYKTDVPQINAAMRADYPTFCRGVMFSILSARVQFPRVPEQCKELKQRGRDAACLWGWKFDAYVYLREHGPKIWLDTCHARTSEDGLWILTRIPGLGVVKAAFVLQMLGHDIACLDVRNIEREGCNPRAYRSDGEARKGKEAFKRKIARYVADTSGRARELWDQWCTDVAADYGSTPKRISALHLTSIVRPGLRNLAPVAPKTNSDIPF